MAEAADADASRRFRNAAGYGQSILTREGYYLGAARALHRTRELVMGVTEQASAARSLLQISCQSESESGSARSVLTLALLGSASRATDARVAPACVYSGTPQRELPKLSRINIVSERGEVII